MIEKIKIDGSIRNASEVDTGFPYRSKLVCYILLEDNLISQPIHYRKSDIGEMINACKKVKEGKAKLFAVWPGNYRSDLFFIDDVNKLIDDLGLKI